MAQRRIILVSVVFFSLTVFTVQTLPQTRRPSPPKPPDTERLRNMTEEESEKEIEKKREQWKLYLERLRNMTVEERKRELAKRRRQRKLEFAQKKKELAKVGRGPLIDREQKRKETQERVAKIKKEFLFEKSALRATEEQWKVIKPKLEKVRHLREQANSMVGLSLISSSGSRSVPTWKWRIRWKDKSTGKLTEAQKLANELLDLVDSKNAKAEAFRRKMDALRKARSEQSQLKKQLSEARQELREVLTTRQEAALVLMYWL